MPADSVSIRIYSGIARFPCDSMAFLFCDITAFELVIFRIAANSELRQKVLVLVLVLTKKSYLQDLCDLPFICEVQRTGHAIAMCGRTGGEICPLVVKSYYMVSNKLSICALFPLNKGLISVCSMIHIKGMQRRF